MAGTETNTGAPDQRRRGQKRRGRRTKQRKENLTLLTLPPELRENSFQFVFHGTAVFFKARGTHTSRREPDFILTRSWGRGLRRFGSWTTRRHPLPDVRRVNWKRSLINLLLVSKQIKNEALPILLGWCTFTFEPFGRARYFLRTTPLAHLEAINMVHFFHAMQERGRNQAQKEAKRVADASFDRMCSQLAQKLPNLRYLTVEIAPHGDTDLVPIAPHFGHRGEQTFTPATYLDKPWFKPLLHFQRLQSLKEVNVKFAQFSDQELESIFFGDRDSREVVPYDPDLVVDPLEQFDMVSEAWVRHQRVLYRSLEEVAAELIMRRTGDSAAFAAAVARWDANQDQMA